MPTTHGPVADADRVDNIVGFRARLPVERSQQVCYFFHITTVPAFLPVQLLHHGLPNDRVTDVLSDVARCEERPVLVTIDFLEDCMMRFLLYSSLSSVLMRSASVRISSLKTETASLLTSKVI